LFEHEAKEMATANANAERIVFVI
jgi:hypothetical protein